jgi:hypothetical protein
MRNRNTYTLNSERLALQSELADLESEMADYLEVLGYGA